MLEHNKNIGVAMTIRHAQMIDRLMNRFGGAAVLSRVEQAEPAMPWEPAGVPRSFTVQLVELGTDLDLQAGTLIQAGDLVAAMRPHRDVTPKATDKVTIGGRTFNIVSVRQIRTNPESAALYHVLHGRA